MAKTGPLPGVTRGVSGFKVSSDPLAFLVDTPGVMLPRIDNIEVGLKLALTGMLQSSCSPLSALSRKPPSMIDKYVRVKGAIKESVVGREVIADYLLYSMNRLGLWENYMSVWGLKEPSDRIDVILNHIANKMGTISSVPLLQGLVANGHFVFLCFSFRSKKSTGGTGYRACLSAFPEKISQWRNGQVYSGRHPMKSSREKGSN